MFDGDLTGGIITFKFWDNDPLKDWCSTNQVAGLYSLKHRLLAEFPGYKTTEKWFA